LDASVGTTNDLTGSSTVTIIDPFDEYVNVLKSCFDFAALREFSKKPGFSLLFDGMHGAGGPFARRVLVEELGLPEVRPNKTKFISLKAMDFYLTFLSCSCRAVFSDATLYQTSARATQTPISLMPQSLSK